MNQFFVHQKGRNVEVYVDEILVKSQFIANLIPDLEETFTTLQQYNLKLNTKKCVFGVRSGKFLRYVVIERDIKANPKKV